MYVIDLLTTKEDQACFLLAETVPNQKVVVEVT